MMAPTTSLFFFHVLLPSSSFFTLFPSDKFKLGTRIEQINFMIVQFFCFRKHQSKKKELKTLILVYNIRNFCVNVNRVRKLTIMYIIKERKGEKRGVGIQGQVLNETKKCTKTLAEETFFASGSDCDFESSVLFVTFC